MNKLNMIDVNEVPYHELLILISCRLLTMTKHSESFIREQKLQIQKMILSKAIKQECLETLDMIELEK